MYMTVFAYSCVVSNELRNKLNQLYISRLLQKMNIEFDIVENGLLAVELAAANEYTAILIVLVHGIMTKIM